MAAGLEFAVAADGAVWLTQARPITTLFPLPASAPTDERDLRVYFSFNVAQGVFRPMTPMGLPGVPIGGVSFVRVAGGSATDPTAGPSFLVEAAGRLFLDLTGLIRTPIGRRLAPMALDHVEARSAGMLRSVLDDPRLAIRRGRPVRTALGVARFLARTRLPVGVGRAVVSPERARARVWQLRARMMAETAPPAGISPLERVEWAERLLLEWPPRLVPRLLPLLLVGLGSLALAERLLRPVASAGELEALRRSLPHNPTTEMDLALWGLAEEARRDAEAAAAIRERPAAELAAAYRAGALPRVLQLALAEFLGRYGHRAVAEIDLGVPRWGEDPTHLLGTLKNYLQLPAGEQGPAAQFRAGAAEAERVGRALTGRASRRNPLRGGLAAFLLSRGRALAGERETPKFTLVLLLAGAREVLAPLGEILVDLGRLDAPEDLWQLDLAEVRAGLAGADLRPLARARRAQYGEEVRRRHVPRLLLSDGTEPTVATTVGEEDANTLRGTPASAGQVTGRRG